MAAKVNVNSSIGFDAEIECPVCKDDFVTSKRLPCNHTFCLACLEKLHKKQPVANLSCPMCRQVHEISLEGLKILPGNKSIDVYFKLRKIVAYTMRENEKCQMHMQPVMCVKHAKEMCKYHCFSCNTIACSKCMSIDHVLHKHASVNRSFTKLSGILKSEISRLNHIIGKYRNNLEQRKSLCLDGVKKAHSEICQRAEELVQMVKESERELLNTVASMKCDALVKLQNDSDNIDQQEIALGDFMDIGKMIRQTRAQTASVVKISEWCQLSNEVTQLAVELNQNDCNSVTFTATNLLQYLPCQTINLIGCVASSDKQADSGMPTWNELKDQLENIHHKHSDELLEAERNFANAQCLHELALKRAEDRVRELEKKLNKAVENEAALRKRLTNAEGKTESTKKCLHNSEVEIRRQNTVLGELNERIDKLTRQIKSMIPAGIEYNKSSTITAEIERELKQDDYRTTTAGLWNQIESLERTNLILVEVHRAKTSAHHVAFQELVKVNTDLIKSNDQIITKAETLLTKLKNCTAVEKFRQTTAYIQISELNRTLLALNQEYFTHLAKIRQILSNEQITGSSTGEHIKVCDNNDNYYHANIIMILIGILVFVSIVRIFPGISWICTG